MHKKLKIMIIAVVLNIITNRYVKFEEIKGMLSFFLVNKESKKYTTELNKNINNENIVNNIDINTIFSTK